MNLKANSDWLIVKGENLSYKTRNGVVGGETLAKAGAGLKAEVLVSASKEVPVGSVIEFQRNMGIELRPNIYSVKEQNVFFVGDLDELLKTKEDGAK